MKPLISVIVPVYRVEPYLRKCVDSLLAQTYPHFELILVDDGSPDRCGEICEAYAATNANVKVFHTENHGLSAARNYGMAHAEGVYWSFVDSDDYVDPAYLSYLYFLTDQGTVPLAIGGYQKEDTQGRLISHLHVQPLHLSPEEALRDLCYNTHFSPNAWGKLYHRSLFNGIRYPEGMLYEDLAVIYKLIDAASSISVGPKIVYHYLYRSQSIMNRKFDEKNLELLQVSSDMLAFFAAKYPALYPAAERRYVVSCFQALNAAIWPQHAALIKKLRKEIQRHSGTLLRKSGTMRDKAAVLALLVGIRPYEFLKNKFLKASLQ